ncbi:hypothetical protein TNCV_1948851 [Trichonephila clavipes]|nr:hypothetical protein TNCV_1948851 [Trichonephila clavipes]
MALGGSLPQINLGVQEYQNQYVGDDGAASGQKSPSRPPTDIPARLCVRNFISHISPTPTKREHTNQ